MAEIMPMRKQPPAPESARERAMRLAHEAEQAAGDVFAEAIDAAQHAMQLCAEAGRMSIGHQGVRQEIGQLAAEIESRLAVVLSIRARNRRP